jgi:hypothetical protein
MWVGISLGGNAMRCPAGMGNTCPAIRRIFIQSGFQRFYFTFASKPDDIAMRINNRDTG